MFRDNTVSPHQTGRQREFQFTTLGLAQNASGQTGANRVQF